MTQAEAADHVAIRAALSACSQAGDARKAGAYASAFTEDGVLQLAPPIEGREALRRWMGATTAIAQPGGPAPGYVSHHLTTCRIELTSETTASVRTYWLVITAMGLDHSGYYDDRFRKVDGDWLIEHRRPRTLWTSPHSLVQGG